MVFQLLILLKNQDPLRLKVLEVAVNICFLLNEF